MNQNRACCVSKSNRSVIIIALFLVAAILDLKYKGQFYRLLPERVQQFVDVALSYR